MTFIKKLKKRLGISKEEPQLVSFDGKEANSTGRKKGTDEEIKNIQILNVFDYTNGIIIGSNPIDDKTNEIPTAQSILSKINLKNTIVTADALHAQKRTTQIIIEQKGDYVLGIKGNQGRIFQSINDNIKDEDLDAIKEKGIDYYESTETSHGAINKREFFMINSKKIVILNKEEWTCLRNIICYKKTITKNDKSKVEIRYYITSLNNVETSAYAIRGHWGIENQLHWFLDTVFYEDMNRTMDKVAYNNYSIINKMVLSVLRIVKSFYKFGLKAIQKKMGWDHETTIAEILNFLSNDQIHEALEKANKKI